MQEIIISKNEAGQRADKFLSKFLCRAPKNFIYKMTWKSIWQMYCIRELVKTHEFLRSKSK